MTYNLYTIILFTKYIILCLFLIKTFTKSLGTIVGEMSIDYLSSLQQVTKL